MRKNTGAKRKPSDKKVTFPPWLFLGLIRLWQCWQHLRWCWQEVKPPPQIPGTWKQSWGDALKKYPTPCNSVAGIQDYLIPSGSVCRYCTRAGNGFARLNSITAKTATRKLLVLENQMKVHNLKFRIFPEGLGENAELRIFIANWIISALKLEDGVAPLIDVAYGCAHCAN